MALGDHFRELRARLMRASTLLVIAMIVALVFYDQLATFILEPYYRARHLLPDGVESEIVVNGLTASLLIQIKICALAAVITTSPYWLLQVWRFVLPGLHARERRWTRIFAGVAGPLFCLGAAVGFYILPKGIQVLISFAPANVNNLVQVDDYISFVTRMMLVFGIAFEIPLFVVMLYLAGLLRAAKLVEARPWLIVAVFIFAAIATPSTDPFSMLMLGVPMTILLLISEVIVRVLDRRRGSTTTDLSDDEASSIDD
jgi:sec-independent protein translocase protein TatC